MVKNEDRNRHKFIVSGVALAEDHVADGIAIVLEDARGGSVRLHLNSEMAELLSSKVALAISKKTGP